MKDTPVLNVLPVAMPTETGQFTCVRALRFLRCRPSFVKVRCDWSIRVVSVFRSFALVCLPVLGTFVRTGRSTCHLCSAVLTLFACFLHCSLWLVDSRVICSQQAFRVENARHSQATSHCACFVDCARFCWTARSVRTGVDQSD